MEKKRSMDESILLKNRQGITRKKNNLKRIYKMENELAILYSGNLRFRTANKVNCRN